MADKLDGAKRKKVWKGEKRTGPQPARHIPWPEVFKHHISVVEGHLKMMEMIQKHTVDGTGNHATISSMVERSKKMLHEAKDQSRSFVPQAGERERVPIGSKSDSTYPGYSPAHIEYGKAAQEAGAAIATIKAKGEDWKPANGVEYKMGQGHGDKKKSIFSKERALEGENTAKSTDPETDGAEEDGNPYFVIDTNPTPVNLKRKSSSEEKKEKKSKKAKSESVEPEAEPGSPMAVDTEPVVETEDISAEVEAKLKEKKEKHKKESKRRRESGGDDDQVVKKSKKDKSKKREGDADEGEDKKKKRKKEKGVED